MIRMAELGCDSGINYRIGGLTQILGTPCAGTRKLKSPTELPPLGMILNIALLRIIKCIPIFVGTLNFFDFPNFVFKHIH
jgi:hypothetical protein